MDAGESGTRQSGFTSFSRPDSFSQYPREPTEKHSRERPPNMAAAALMSTAPGYHAHNPSYPSPYSHQPPASMPGILSPGQSSRRTSKDSEPAPRQSLPSISEMFNAKPSGYSPTTPTTASGPPNLPAPPPPPPPYHSTLPPRPDAVPETRPPPPVFAQRAENGAPGPMYQYGDPREPPRAAEPQRNGSFSGPHMPQAKYTATGQLPPGQLPLSQAPSSISPRHSGPPMPPQYESSRPPMHSDEDYGVPRRYDPQALNRQFEVWGYTECLRQILCTSRTIANFAEAYSNIALEQHGGQPIPQRLPTDKEVSEMLNNTDFLRKTLDSIREVIHHSIANERARDSGKQRGPYEDDDISMYGDGMKHQYGLGEVKKRRGRAAPPGRCHSCNRIDTPEWRRGPDGARTLCNACGLHYAKLERKRQTEQRSMRGKAVD